MGKLDHAFLVHSDDCCVICDCVSCCVICVLGEQHIEKKMCVLNKIFFLRFYSM